MKIKEVISALEMFAPLPLQDGFDNAGLQVGLTDVEATGALLCLDVTEAVVDEAISLGYNLIISHHPLLFKSCKSLTGKDFVERCIIKAVKHDIAIFAMHTNLDNAPQGVNYKIAEKLGLRHVTILDAKENSLLKLVTFVPENDADKVRHALFNAGCGCIGNYDACSYNIKGTGTFRAGEGTHPYCGEIGKLHEEKEVRIETILPDFRKQAVTQVLIETHPYEEPAYDFYPLANEWKQAGAGIIGELEEGMSEEDFLMSVKQIFKAGCIKHSRTTGKKVQKIALCGGAGAFLLTKAVAAKADAFITGEVKYHDYFSYEGQILITEIGHYESEQYTTEIFHSFLERKFPTLNVQTTHINTNPIKYL